MFAPGIVISTPNQVRDFPGAPLAETWYATALADAITGVDQNPGEFDLDIYMASNGPWYFGLDAGPPSGQLDFVKIVLHELAHGLGFIALFEPDGAAASYGTVGAGDLAFDVPLSFTRLDYGGLPTAFERGVENAAGQRLTDPELFPNGSESLGRQVLGDALFFNGCRRRRASAVVHPRFLRPGVEHHPSRQGYVRIGTERLDDGGEPPRHR